MSLHVLTITEFIDDYKLRGQYPSSTNTYISKKEDLLDSILIDFLNEKIKECGSEEVISFKNTADHYLREYICLLYEYNDSICINEDPKEIKIKMINNLESLKNELDCEKNKADDNKNHDADLDANLDADLELMISKISDSLDKMTENSSDKMTENSLDKMTENSLDKMTENSLDKMTENSSDKISRILHPISNSEIEKDLKNFEQSVIKNISDYEQNITYLSNKIQTYKNSMDPIYVIRNIKTKLFKAPVNWNSFNKVWNLLAIGQFVPNNMVYDKTVISLSELDEGFVII